MRKRGERVVVEALGEPLALREPARRQLAVRVQEAVGAHDRHRRTRRVGAQRLGQRGRRRALPHRDAAGDGDDERLGAPRAVGEELGERTVDLEHVGDRDLARPDGDRRGGAAARRPLGPVEVLVARHGVARYAADRARAGGRGVAPVSFGA